MSLITRLLNCLYPEYFQQVVFCQVFYACRRSENVTNCEVVQKHRRNLVVYGVDNNVESYRLRLMDSITDTNTEVVCCWFHTLMNRLDVVDESRAEMKLAERNFIQTASLSGCVKDGVMLSSGSGRTQGLILTHLDSSIALLKAWGGKSVLQKPILRWAVHEKAQLVWLSVRVCSCQLITTETHARSLIHHQHVS